VYKTKFDDFFIDWIEDNEEIEEIEEIDVLKNFL